MKVLINDNFDLEKIVYSGQCFRAKMLDDGWFRFITGDYVLEIKKSSAQKTCLKGAYEVSCSQDDWDNIWSQYFDLETNYSNIRQQIPSSDTYISNAANVGLGIRILKQDYWEMLISFIISQRKSIPAIRSAVEKLCKLYGHEICKGIYSFPRPEEMYNASYDDLKSCGLGYRVDYILDAIDAVNSASIDLEKIALFDDENLFDALCSIKGVGKKVANCIMLFAYHRLDRAPVDTWIQKVMDQYYDGENPFVKYGEVAGVMQQYVFYSAQHMKEI